jgi:hypothetical protein
MNPSITISIHIENLHVHLPSESAPAIQAAVEATRLPSPEAPSQVDPSPKHIQLPPPKRRRKCQVPDVDLIAEAKTLAEEAAARASADETMPAPSTTPPAEPPVAEQDHAPEDNASDVPFKPDTGEIIQLLPPDSPEIKTIRDLLRSLGYHQTDKMLAFISELVGRPVDRIGAIDIEEARGVIGHLNQVVTVR